MQLKIDKNPAAITLPTPWDVNWCETVFRRWNSAKMFQQKINRKKKTKAAAENRFEKNWEFVANLPSLSHAVYCTFEFLLPFCNDWPIVVSIFRPRLKHFSIQRNKHSNASSNNDNNYYYYYYFQLSRLKCSRWVLGCCFPRWWFQRKQFLFKCLFCLLQIACKTVLLNRVSHSRSANPLICANFPHSPASASLSKAAAYIYRTIKSESI